MRRKVFLNVTDGSLAGGGISSMFKESRSAFEKLCSAKGWEMLTVSGEPDSATNRHFQFVADSYLYRHEQAIYFVKRLLTELKGAEVSAFIWGYTSYFPNAFQEHLQRKTVKAVAWADSSPPDTDELGIDTHSSRFVSSAYDGTTEIVWSWHDFNDRDPRLISRVPSGARLVKTSRPFPSEYLADLQALGFRAQVSRDRKEARVVLAVSPDYWLPDGVGKWMTAQQWQDVRSRTLSVLAAFQTVADKLPRGRKLSVVANPVLAQLGFKPANFRLRLEKFQPQAYRELLAASDLVVVRTSCCVTAVECAHIGVPQYLCLMPGLNYMNVEVFEDSARARGVVLAAGESAAEGILAGIEHGGESATEAWKEAQAFNQSHNFFNTINSLLLS